MKVPFNMAIKRGNKSVFATLFISFFVVFIVPVTISSVVYLKIEQILIDNAYRANEAMLEQTKHVINGKTQEIDSLMRQVAFHPKQQVLMQKPADPAQPKEQYQYIELMKDLARYKAYSSLTLIYDMYVYFGNTDTIVSPSMKTDSSTLFQQIYKYKGMTENSYRSSLLLGSHFKSYLSTDLIISQFKAEPMITFIQSLPFGELGPAKGSLVVLIQKRQFTDLLREVEGLHNGSIYILNQQGELLIGPEGEGQNSEVMAHIKPSLEKTSGKFLLPVQGADMLVSYTTSSENGWTYVSVFPKDVVLAQVNRVKLWSLLLMAICLAMGTLLCVFLARRHYSPIKGLVAMIKHGRTAIGSEGKNELNFIAETMQQLFGKEAEMEHRLSSQMPIIRSDFLSRLIRGQIDGREVTHEDLSFMGINVHHNDFVIIILDVEESPSFLTEDTEREWILLRFIMNNVSQELLNGDGYMLELGKKRMLVLVPLNDVSDEDDHRIHAYARSFIEMMASKFRTAVSAGISRRHSGLERLSECFEEATIALSYKMTRGTRSITYYDEVQNWQSETYRLPPELEAQLLNYTRNGDFQNAARLLDHLYDLNFEQDHLTPEMGRWFFLDLLSTLIKLLESEQIDYREVLGDETEPSKLITDTDTALSAHLRIKEMFRLTASRIQADKVDPQDALLRKIREFIQAHYHDNNLGLSMIADHLNMNPVYISSFFKKKSGENVTDFITRIRIENAKRLLAEENLTIHEIALEIGYASNIVLTKVFKKLEGITPGKYREGIAQSKTKRTDLKNG
ncbi:AraC-like DNA-binding protein [Paenibacillus rhizosphaerae]|uniref:AraC-like DNA-binding protein n=1 Tax=Paenibacillus rhizosphaerae TaxID=297318 RepID=A0A839TJ97_9BACL|nr:helix-turn-helix domain-containing protein [Paenibacillus rhizosphaerae]MBB3125419.1 AraC-like DNA-binding protein [Paenibacillus rhizosphaerae]